MESYICFPSHNSLHSFYQRGTVGNFPAAKFVFATMPSGTKEITMESKCTWTLESTVRQTLAQTPLNP